MNIVYTINGEGMGHASRSSVVIEYLLSKGHAVTIFSAGMQPVRYLREKFGSVAEVMGFHMVYQENRVRRVRTALRILNNLTDVRKDIKTIRRTLLTAQPDLVITDFDPHGQVVASLFKVPIISIDNIQLLNYTTLKTEPKDFIDYELNVLVAKMMVPHADYYFITTFEPDMLVNKHGQKNLFFVPPLLRSKVLQQKAQTGEHILVYQTSDSYSKLIPILAQTKEQYCIYNSRQRVNSKNIVYKTFNEDGFIADLASSKAVITNGGFNVITEALYFQKPILSIPIANHFEQKLNSMLLTALGLGQAAPRISNAVLGSFLNDIKKFAAVSSRIQFDNTVLFKKLDSVMASLTSK